ncbi:MAG TPA: DUF1810 domain-containing protein [Casimicrobiaceae bacterium]|nr:DUF1810 domain-containing protein [Casimicrobiaceae bacterium]
MTAANGGAFDLDRFVEAQASAYDVALGELRSGRKRSHWIWYVLPQLRGLGASRMSTRYGLQSLAEAVAYLAHPLLGPRLRECVRTLNALPGSDAVAVLGGIDALKLRSCLTVFAEASDHESLFVEALDKYFHGQPDAETLSLLGRTARSRSQP